MGANIPYPRNHNALDEATKAVRPVAAPLLCTFPFSYLQKSFNDSTQFFCELPLHILLTPH